MEVFEIYLRKFSAREMYNESRIFSRQLFTCTLLYYMVRVNTFLKLISLTYLFIFSLVYKGINYILKYGFKKGSVIIINFIFMIIFFCTNFT